MRANTGKFTIRPIEHTYCSLGFERGAASMGDDCVVVSVNDGGWCKTFTITASGWQSIVAHVSAGGGRAEDYKLAEALHRGT